MKLQPIVELRSDIGAAVVAPGPAWFVDRRKRLASQVKRWIDVCISLSALVLLAPAFAVIALVIKATSRGPVLFRQERIGQDGKPFNLFKFRTMFVDAEARRAALLEASDRKGVCFKSRHDPRVTSVGRLLRRASIDEVPQLMNVLAGTMSLVGPRPALPDEVRSYPPHARRRLACKPGITGLWQVSGRADIGFEAMVDMDLAYVRNRTVLLDLMILALTARAIVSGRGAY